MPKHIFVTGGVVSSLGKGITAASIGLLLKSRGLKVIHQKFDPYLNVDPGTMSPYQHGEVYVTDDGAETDLDLGHYERFTGVSTNKNCNFTTGRIYETVLKKERRGDYLGGTVQVVPHVTGEICDAIRSVDSEDVDVVISEIGGTVGDIESLPFLEALRQFRHQEGSKNVYFIHVTLIPYLKKAGEVKTKPTQHSVGRLREIGIIPDMLVCRTEKHLTDEVKNKLSLFCNVDRENVVDSFDVDHTIYQVPLAYAEQDMDTRILDYFGLDAGQRHLEEWRNYIDNVINSHVKIKIAVVGKYAELIDAYKSIHESLDHAGALNKVRVELCTVNAEDIEKKGAEAIIGEMDGILIPGGFGKRGHEGKITAIKYARENKIPFLGICLGMQMAVVEFARNVVGLKDADSTELNPDTPHPVIALMEDQKDVKDMGGTMRLGAYPCKVENGSLAHSLYGATEISERHRHRYEFNNKYRDELSKKGLKLSGIAPDDSLVEMVEIDNHPYFIAAQFHPEFKSRPIAPHPLFAGLVEAAKTYGGDNK
jgi:CTP synthase